MPTRWRKSATHHLLDYAHQQRRKALLPAALGARCPIAGPKCDGVMTVPARMHLDHTVPRAVGGTVGDRIVCMPCNCGNGARLGNRLRQVRHQARQLPRW
jgi:hypothetical protein